MESLPTTNQWSITCKTYKNGTVEANWFTYSVIGVGADFNQLGNYPL